MCRKNYIKCAANTPMMLKNRKILQKELLMSLRADTGCFTCLLIAQKQDTWAVSSDFKQSIFDLYESYHRDMFLLYLLLSPLCRKEGWRHHFSCKYQRSHSSFDLKVKGHTHMRGLVLKKASPYKNTTTPRAAAGTSSFVYQPSHR